MGDRFTWIQACPKCQAVLECYYAESCGFTTVTCQECGEEFDIVQSLFLKSKKPTGEYGGWKEVKK